MPDAYDEAVSKRLGGFRRRVTKSTDSDNDKLVSEMGKNRAVNRRIASGAGGGGGAGAQFQFATGRPRDPMFYWKQNNLPYDFSKHDELKKIRQITRMFYMTHPIVGSCVDIFSKYPLLGMELRCKDEALTEFYTDLFIDERNGLNYPDFLIDVGREYWTVGEAWPFGSFNETLGVWEDDELLNPDDVEISRSLFSKDPRFLIKLPETLRKVINDMSPRWEYDQLMNAYPELREYAGPDALMPVSNILLRQMKFKADTFNKRGVPLLMRALRPMMQEEMLNAAQDSIADRLYTPLLLVKLGASATDLGTQVPWIPTDDDLADFEEAFDAAMAADFRALIYHFAVDMEPVFGRENMPNMDADFDRLEGRILQTFGLSQTMLSGATGGETYAADAMNRDLISQLLTVYQKLLKSHYMERAYVVAEAQEHFDYDERQGRRYVKMEEILEVDEETGEERIVEQPKLLVPDMEMKSMSMQDENAWHQFVEALNMAGVPLSMKTRLRNVNIDLEEEIETRKEEQVQLAVAEQEVRKETYLALRAANLPIPDDLKADFEPTTAQAIQQAEMAERIPALGLDPTAMNPNMAPMPEDLAPVPPDGSGIDPMAQGAAGGMAPGMMMPPPPQGNPDVPPESNEQKATMPKPARLSRTSVRIKQAALEHFSEPDDSSELPEDRRPHGKFGHPKHIGVRRYIDIDPATPLDEE